jgi:putative endonuclease
MHCVYILASKRYGTLYTGYTSNIAKRMMEHQQALADGQEICREDVGILRVSRGPSGALVRERQIKEWKRLWKIEMIEKSNPNFDL